MYCAVTPATPGMGTASTYNKRSPGALACGQSLTLGSSDQSPIVTGQHLLGVLDRDDVVQRAAQRTSYTLCLVDVVAANDARRAHVRSLET